MREYAGAFMSGLLFACLFRTLECMLTRIIRLERTALYWAVEHNQPASIEALVNLGADVDARDE